MSERIVHVYFDLDKYPDLSWLSDDENPDDYVTLIGWATVECPCCGQERSVTASLGNITVFKDGRWVTGEFDFQNLANDEYLTEVAQDLREEAQNEVAR